MIDVPIIILWATDIYFPRPLEPVLFHLNVHIGKYTRQFVPLNLAIAQCNRIVLAHEWVSNSLISVSWCSVTGAKEQLCRADNDGRGCILWSPSWYRSLGNLPGLEITSLARLNPCCPNKEPSDLACDCGQTISHMIKAHGLIMRINCL